MRRSATDDGNAAVRRGKPWMLVALLLMVAAVGIWRCTTVAELAPPTPPVGTVPALPAAEPVVVVPASEPTGLPPIGEQSHAVPTVAAPPVAPGPAHRMFVVVDENGAPVGGARVTAIDGEHDLASGFADVAGELDLDGVPPAFDYRVTNGGHWPVQGHRADATATTRVVLPIAPRLRGRVFDRGSRPVAGARVELLAVVAGRVVGPPVAAPRTPLAFSDALGAFDLAWPDAAPRDVLVTARGYAPFVAPELAAATVGDTLFTVTLLAGASVQGTASQADGEPLVRVAVEVWSTAPTPVGGGAGRTLPWREHQLLRRTTTGTDGAFAIDDLPALAQAAILLAPEQGASAWYGALVGGSVTHVDLVAAAMARVQGRVAGGGRLDHVYLYAGPRWFRTERVGEDGAFGFDAVPPRSYLVGVAVPPFAETLHRATQDWIVGGDSPFATAIELAPGEVRTLSLTRPSATTGAVAGGALVGGQPAVGHEVVLRPVTGEGAFVRRTKVNAAGLFVIEGVRPGDYEAELRAADASVLVQQACRVVVGEPVRVTLSAP